MLSRMVSWHEVEKAEPEFAAKVRRLFDAGKHKTLATLRADGSPRISGIEVEFGDDGELRFGSMPGARKGADLRRDPRFALHSATFDPPDDHAQWPGEAKVAGRAHVEKPLDGADGPEGELFRADLDEVVFTGLNASASLLVVEFWRPGTGLRRVERA